MTEIQWWARQSRAEWEHRGEQRPRFADVPGPGQESVWDYPRPPALVEDTRRVMVMLDDTLIANTVNALRVLETASPPTFYLPPADVDQALLRDGSGSSLCEWKGAAHYWDVVIGRRTISAAGWCYPEPFPPYAPLRGYLAFYPGKLHCFVDGERVTSQAGDFYGGWITSDIAGPFKGASGHSTW